jgi:integrase
MSENTLGAALLRMGYAREVMVAHGFRSMASTLLNEQGWHPDVIELQLAHRDKDETRRTYNRAARLADRRKMMTAWADHLNMLKARGDVTPIRRRA